MWVRRARTFVIVVCIVGLSCVAGGCGGSRAAGLPHTRRAWLAYAAIHRKQYDACVASGYFASSYASLKLGTRVVRLANAIACEGEYTEALDRGFASLIGASQPSRDSGAALDRLIVEPATRCLAMSGYPLGQAAGARPFNSQSYALSGFIDAVESYGDAAERRALAGCHISNSESAKN